MRRGFSVLEAVVGVLLAVVVLAALYVLLSGGARTFAATDARLSGVTAANAALARLRQDLRCAALPPRVEDAGATLRIGAIAWRFDAASGALARDGVAPGARFARVAFAREPLTGLVTVRIVMRRDPRPGPAAPVHAVAAAVWSEATAAAREFPDLAL